MISSYAFAFYINISYQQSRDIIFRLLAALVGIVVAVVMRTIVATWGVRCSFTALYRKRVNRANVASLAVETVNIGLGIISAVVRAIKCAVIPLLFVGRIDVPIFANGLPIQDEIPWAVRI